MIGGIDISLEAPPGVHVVELILGRIRHLWPNSCFQNADQTDVFSVARDWLTVSGSQVSEFFIYKDEKEAQSWQQFGAVPENRNTMIHFLVDELRLSNGVQRITMVCDEETDEIRELKSDLRVSFFNSVPDTVFVCR